MTVSGRSGVLIRYDGVETSQRHPSAGATSLSSV